MKRIALIFVSMLLCGCANRQLYELGLAAAEGDLNKVAQLIDKGVNVNGCVGYEGCVRPLEIAAREGYLEIVKYLVEHGAKINTQNESGNAVFVAALFGRADITHYLLSKGGRLICSESSFKWLIDNMMKSEKKELATEVAKTWIAP
jgi:ankyrin repeat protein